MSGFMISGFADEISDDIKEQFECLNELNMGYFEARGINGTNIADLSDVEVKDLLEMMEKYNIKVSSIGSPVGKINITDDFEEHLEKYKRVLKITKALNSKYIRMFSFYMPENCDYSQYRDDVIEKLKIMTELAKQEGIILLHENEKGIYGDTPERCLDIVNSVNSDNLKLVFDPANYVQCGQDTKKAFELLKDKVVYMHIKDAKEDGTVVPAGMGDGNIEWIVTQLIQRDYEGFLSLEPHLGTFHGLENLEQDDHMLELESSTPEKFKLAHESLIKILVNVKANIL